MTTIKKRGGVRSLFTKAFNTFDTISDKSSADALAASLHLTELYSRLVALDDAVITELEDEGDIAADIEDAERYTEMLMKVKAEIQHTKETGGCRSATGRPNMQNYLNYLFLSLTAIF